VCVTGGRVVNAPKFGSVEEEVLLFLEFLLLTYASYVAYEFMLRDVKILCEMLKNYTGCSVIYV
jgi:hypothetical protein